MPTEKSLQASYRGLCLLVDLLEFPINIPDESIQSLHAIVGKILSQSEPTQLQQVDSPPDNTDEDIEHHSENDDAIEEPRGYGTATPAEDHHNYDTESAMSFISPDTSMGHLMSTIDSHLSPNFFDTEMEFPALSDAYQNNVIVGRNPEPPLHDAFSCNSGEGSGSSESDPDFHFSVPEDQDPGYSVDTIKKLIVRLMWNPFSRYGDKSTGIWMKKWSPISIDIIEPYQEILNSTFAHPPGEDRPVVRLARLDNMSIRTRQSQAFNDVLLLLQHLHKLTGYLSVLYSSDGERKRQLQVLRDSARVSLRTFQRGAKSHPRKENPTAGRPRKRRRRD